MGGGGWGANSFLLKYISFQKRGKTILAVVILNSVSQRVCLSVCLSVCLVRTNGSRY